jgi:hypothetical protein
MPAMTTQPDHAMLAGGEVEAGGGPAGMPAPLQPADPLQGVPPTMAPPPPPPGMPDATQPMPTAPEARGATAAAATSSQPTGAPATAPAASRAVQAPPAVPQPVPGTPGVVACEVADPNSEEGMQCAVAGQGVARGPVAGPMGKVGFAVVVQTPQDVARDKVSAAIDAFVDVARRRPSRILDSAFSKFGSSFEGTPIGLGLQGLGRFGPPPVPAVMRPRTPGAAPAMNLAPAGRGTALSARPLYNGMSAMQGKPMLPGVRGPNGLLGRPGMSVAPPGSEGIGMASPGHKIAVRSDPPIGLGGGGGHGGGPATLKLAAMITRNPAGVVKCAVNDRYADGGMTAEGRGKKDAELARRKLVQLRPALFVDYGVARALGEPVPGEPRRRPPPGRILDPGGTKAAGWLGRGLAPFLKHAEGGPPPPEAGGAPAKASQEEAQYGQAYSAARSCAVCANFDGRSGCAVVEGEVQPSGTSAMFTPRPEMAAVDPVAISAGPAANPQATKLGSHHVGELAVPLALATLGGMAVGGVGGGVLAPKGSRAEGAARGALTGRAVGAFGLGGAAGGGLLADYLARHATGGTNGDSAAIAGALGGGLLGGLGGAKLNRWMMGPPSWERKKDRGAKSAAAALDDLTAKLAARARPPKLRPFMPSKGRAPRRRKVAAEGCGCGGCGTPARKYRKVGPERREGGARFAWRGRGARNVYDDPGYEKYVRKSAAAAALAAVAACRPARGLL